MVDAASIIHKQLISTKLQSETLVQSFNVPRNAHLIAIEWDPKGSGDIAFWYRHVLPHPGYNGELYKSVWNFMVHGTGYEFSVVPRHLKTLVGNSFAWHIFDADGRNIPWAA